MKVFGVKEVEKTKADIFTSIPNELKTVEIDFEKKIFKINGVDFGDDTTDFSINFEAGEGFNVYMDAHTKVRFATYDINGNKITDRITERNGQ